MNTKFGDIKDVPLVDGPMAGARYTAQLYPTNGIIEYFRRKGGELETARYKIGVVDGEIQAKHVPNDQ